MYSGKYWLRFDTATRKEILLQYSGFRTYKLVIFIVDANFRWQYKDLAHSRVRPQCWELSVNLNELYLYVLKYVL